MYEPVPHARAFPPHAHPYDWPEPQRPGRRRRRLSRKGIAVLLTLFAFFCALALAVLKLGLAVYNSPVTPQVANSAARIGTVAADVAMKEAEIPDELREAVTEEAETLRRDLLKGEAEASQHAAPGGAAK